MLGVQVVGGLVVALVLSWVGAPVAAAVGHRLGLHRPQRTGEGRRLRSASYTGGALVAVSATAAFWLAYGASWTTSAAIGAASLLFVLGFIRDRSGRPALAPVPRVAVEVFAAGAAVASGFRPGILAPAWLDAAVAMGLLILGAKSFAALETGAGAAAPAAAAAGGSLLLLAVVSGQPLVAVLAAGLCGASTGFVVPVLNRDRLSLGRAGSGFLGFLLVAAALRLRIPGGGPTAVLAVLCCFGLPVTNAWVTSASRFVFGRHLRRSAADGVVQRLVRRRSSVQRVSLVLAGAAAVGGGAAVGSVAGHTALPALVALTAFGVAGALLVRVEVYEGVAVRRWRQAAVVLAGIALLALGGSLGAALLAQRDLVRARAELLVARRALASLHAPEAQAALDRAQPEMNRAEAWLSSGATIPGRLVPGVRQNLLVAIALSRSGQDLITAGRQSVRVLNALKLQQGGGLTLSGGRIDLQRFALAQEPAAALDQAIARAQRRIAASPTSFLASQVRSARMQAWTELVSARKVADATMAATSLLPAALGKTVPQVWVVGAEDNAEARGRGGYMGSMAVVTTDNGRVTLSAFGDTGDLPRLPPTSTVTDIPPEYLNHYSALGAFAAWQNLTMSPSFSSGGRLLLSMLQASGALHPTGLVGLDPEALANLLAVTGPVSVPGIPEPLSSGNVVDWSLNRIFFLYPAGRSRHNVLASVAGAVWQRILSGTLDPRLLADAMSRSMAGNHLSVYATDPTTENLLRQLGLGGELSDAPGDYLTVVGQNVGENKLDYYAHREVSYRVQVAGDGSAQGTLSVALTNAAPVGVFLPDQLGGARPGLGLAAGTNRTYLSVLVPQGAVLEDVQIDGQSTTDFEKVDELGKRLFGVYLEPGPGATSTVLFRYYLPDAVVGGQYRLTVQNQASVHPDEMSVAVRAPARAVVAGERGFGGGGLEWTGSLTSPRTFSVDLRQGIVANLSHGLEALLDRSAAISFH